MKRVVSNRILSPYEMVGEFEDKYAITVSGQDEDDCMQKLVDLQSKHGKLTWYSGVVKGTRIISTRVGEQKLIDQGYEYYGYEYDGDAQREQNKLESQGYQVKLLRETSDTVGLKMYSLWIKSL